MTPAEKAKELFEDFHYQICADNGLSENDSNIFCAKQCAIIAVELRLKGDFRFISIEFGEDGTQYWEEVKKEIGNI